MGELHVAGLDTRLSRRHGRNAGFLHRLFDLLLQAPRIAHRVADLQEKRSLRFQVGLCDAVAGDTRIRFQLERPRLSLSTRDQPRGVFAGWDQRTAAASRSVRRPRTGVTHIPVEPLHSGFGPQC